MRVALDTNILVYAELEPESEKGAVSRSLILRAARDGVIPAQVLGEFLRVVQRRSPSAFIEAVNQVAIYRGSFPTPPTTADVVAAAASLARDHKLQLWDCITCVAAAEAGAKLLLTEDLQDGAEYAMLRAVNPFNATNAALIDST